MRKPLRTPWTLALRALSVLALLTTGLIDAAIAQSIKPGLWEYRTTMKSKSGEMEAAMAEMQKQMATMPAEQRRQMEQMMGAQGIQFGAGGNNAQVMRMCITAEEASRLDLQGDPSCKQSITQRSGSTMRFSFSCGGEMPSRGEGTYTFKGDTAFDSKFWVETRQQGETDRVDMTQEGRWLGASCGALKPRR